MSSQANQKEAKDKDPEKAERERLQKEAKDAAKLAKDKYDEALAKRGREIKTKTMTKCYYAGAHYKSGSPGPVFYGEITCPHFVEA